MSYWKVQRSIIQKGKKLGSDMVVVSAYLYQVT